MNVKEKINKPLNPATLFRCTLVVLAVSYLFPASLTAKDGPQSMLELRRLALEFIQQQNSASDNTRIEFARWDTRLKLGKCDSHKIQVFYPGKQQRLGNVSVGLRCLEGKSWTVYLRAFITVQQKIVLSKRFISRGKVITKDDLVIDTIEVSNSNRQYFNSPSSIIGQVAKRNIPVGRKILSTILKPAMLIKRGNEVVIIAQTAGILIRTKGKALSDGAIGQIVKVRNLRSQRELQATVIAPNTVKVNM